jgi:hypothetical protein
MRLYRIDINRSFVHKAKEGSHVRIYHNEVWLMIYPQYNTFVINFVLKSLLCITIHTNSSQHKLCATFSANVNINYRLPIKAYYRICTLRPFRIEINHVCPFVLFLLATALSVLLRFTDSDYPFVIFKLFLCFR